MAGGITVIEEYYLAKTIEGLSKKQNEPKIAIAGNRPHRLVTTMQIIGQRKL